MINENAEDNYIFINAYFVGFLKCCNIRFPEQNLFFMHIIYVYG